MSGRLLISGGTVYDPTNQIHGEVLDLQIEGGKIVSRFSEDQGISRIDARGMVVMPGGVDIHCHIVGPCVNRARRLLPEFVYSTSLLNSTVQTGFKYAALGYTTAIEAAIAATGARQAHFELHNTPNLSAGFLLLLGNHELILETLAHGSSSELQAVVTALLERTGAFGIKIVNPGAVANWQRHGGNPLEVESIDQPLGSSRVTPRAILTGLADIATALKLPHPIHVHANRLGVPGNVEITLQTLAALAGRRHHLTHVQFHSYGQREGKLTSASERLMDHINAHPETTCDIGQVLFGSSVTLTEDSPLEYLLWQLTGQRYVNLDLERESGCGMLPFEFKDKVALHALQFVIGLELFLLAKNPWQVALSTDHPNGASFVGYPEIIRLLMDSAYRREQCQRLPVEVQEQSCLRDLHREYTLSEIAIITRAAPARMLGLQHAGHLGVGADADITIYQPAGNPAEMFRTPRWVVKAGEVLLEDGYLRSNVAGKRLWAQVPEDSWGHKKLKQWQEEQGSYGFDQFGLLPCHRNAWMKA